MRILPILALALFLSGISGCAEAEETIDSAPGILYTNIRMASKPWSIHIVRVSRRHPEFAIHSVHSGGRAIGLSPLSGHARLLKDQFTEPLAGINGDFYERNSTYAGDPRGLQVCEGELLSAPAGRPSMWIDNAGNAQLANVQSEFMIVWPDGTRTPFELNGERSSERAVLYTPMIGRSTRTDSTGRELLLAGEDGGSFLRLELGRRYFAKVSQIRKGGDSPIPAGKAVLSIGSSLWRQLPSLEKNARVQLVTLTSPGISRARTAISGGPILLQQGARVNLRGTRSPSFSERLISERHPRTAIGWNREYYFLVQVDGRQRRLSKGMTLDELAAYLESLGCTDAMNLDGGGSSTLWFGGKVRNSPCDGDERDIANSLIVTRRAPPVAASQ